MAQITLTIDDTQVNRISDGLGWTATIKDVNGNVIPNPLTRGQYIKKFVGAFVIRQVKTYESRRDAMAAAQTASDNVDSQITIS